ncbi:hypothetical protein IJ098_03335 [Candidatus Saccharibacteria bacterium]|nr:hypothetical protein [Candidatus Saccharibacteria bacterium]
METSSKITKPKKIEKMPEELDEKQKEKRGSRNLTILGIVSTGIAILTTAVSLIVYHNSGDIYLDRSRPGYLPDKSEIQTQVESSYDFSVTGPLTKEVLDEYIKHYNEELNIIDDLEAPFSEEPLSDKSLGIPEPQPEPVQEEAPAEEQPYYWWY